MSPFRLRDGFLLGVATAATQVEGGDRNNSWYDWAARGHVKDGSTPLRANDHWKRFREDIARMASMRVQVCRMGLEWSRFEPEEGRFDAAAIAHYRDELQALRAAGIRPLVTLHHFSNPMWFEERGAFETPDGIDVFLRFVRKAVESLGDLCSEWVTINEPNVYATNGYFFGDWPPGKKDLRLAMRVMRHMAVAHMRAYRAIHEIRSGCGFGGATKVGFANHFRVFVPMRAGSLVDRIGARAMERLFQGAVTRSMLTGRLSLPLGHGRPCGKGPFADYIGVNYYTRSAVKGFSAGILPGVPASDLGWEAFPDGLAQIVRKCRRIAPLPVWITENGICVRDDRRRIRYVAEHLAQVAEDPSVERYYHWTFIDNFEWLEGEGAPFGLIALDFATQERRERASGRFFADVIAARGLTWELVEKYRKDL
jgi:beta-glucosidase